MVGNYVVTERLARAIRAEPLMGYALDVVEVSKGEDFRAFFPRTRLPRLRWLKIVGVAGQSDFGFAPRRGLVVSDRALAVMRRFAMRQASVEPFRRPARSRRRQNEGKGAGKGSKRP